MYNFKNHKHNYHAHTWLCRHAGGEVIDYVKEGIKHNYKVIGISEHAPFELLERWGSTRMSFKEFKIDYMKQFSDALPLATENNIVLYKGLEIEYYPTYNDYYETLLEDLDYLILGQHYVLSNNQMISAYALNSLDDIILYRDSLMEAMRTNYFSLICHPEVALFGVKDITDDIYEAFRPLIKLSKELNIPLELNANGIRRNFGKKNNNPRDFDSYLYPKPRFWQMVKEEGAKGIISSDAHSPDALHDEAIEIAYEFAKEIGFELIQEIPFKLNKFRK